MTDDHFFESDDDDDIRHADDKSNLYSILIVFLVAVLYNNLMKILTVDLAQLCISKHWEHYSLHLIHHFILYAPFNQLSIMRPIWRTI